MGSSWNVPHQRKTNYRQINSLVVGQCDVEAALGRHLARQGAAAYLIKIPAC
jgi:hypothetical protein